MHAGGGDVAHAPADVRASLRELHYDMAGAPVPELLGALLRIADPARLHYGSDWPFTANSRVREAAGGAEDHRPVRRGGTPRDDGGQCPAPVSTAPERAGRQLTASDFEAKSGGMANADYR